MGLLPFATLEAEEFHPDSGVNAGTLRTLHFGDRFLEVCVVDILDNMFYCTEGTEKRKVPPLCPLWLSLYSLWTLFYNRDNANSAHHNWVAE